ncbi:MAG TPA: IclR family transcriptional regulator [Anaerolineales bacterium]
MGLEPLEQQQNQTLAKALRILDMFSAQQPEWGIRELGRELGINPTTVYRLVSTLSQAGFLEKNPETQAYSLGPKVVKLAGLYSHVHPITEVARRVFESYADRFVHNFYLGKLSYYEVIYLTVLEGRAPIRVIVEPGGSTFIHSTALGKVLLAFQSDEYIQNYLNRSPLTRFSNRTIVEPAVLLEQIEQIRRLGYAVNDGEQFEDIGAVAVPLFDPDRKGTLAISLTYPRHLIYEQRLAIPELVALSNEIRDEISMRYSGKVQRSPGQENPPRAWILG